jgi:hypothetical protein
MRWALLLGALSSCLPFRVPSCRTGCGMGAYVDEKACQELSEAEAEGVEAFAYLDEGLCDRLSEWTLYTVTHETSWVDSWGRTVAGLTYCDLQAVEVAGTNWTRNAYWHELAHLAQCPTEDGAHRTWEGLEIWSHLEALRIAHE